MSFPLALRNIMSLIPFHRFLIATAIVFCAGFAAWELVAFIERGGIVALALALAFGGAAVAFGYYLRHLSRFLNLPAGKEDHQGDLAE